jgi:hypothetical protein
MKYTPIPDKDAAMLLDVSQGTIRNAVSRGDLIRVPVAGQVQHVAREQVELFKGKKQLRIASLDEEARRVWSEVQKQIKLMCEERIGTEIANKQLLSTLLENALVGRVRIYRHQDLKGILVSNVKQDELERITVLLHMLEIAASGHQQEHMEYIAEQILRPLRDADYIVFYWVLSEIIAILQEYKCLTENTVERMCGISTCGQWYTNPLYA